MYVLITKSKYTTKVTELQHKIIKNLLILPVQEDFRVQIIQMALVFKL
jgi:hypothetical protein